MVVANLLQHRYSCVLLERQIREIDCKLLHSCKDTYDDERVLPLHASRHACALLTVIAVRV